MAIRFSEIHFPKSERQKKRKSVRTTESFLIVSNLYHPKFVQIFMMELLPEELKNLLPKLYEQEGIEDQKVFIKYFFPAGNWTWFVTEGEPRGDDFLFFGYVIGLDKEWGYFTLKQLEEININYLTVERDLYFRQEEFSRCLARWKLERGG